jgi:hypothetical protein
VAIIGRRLSSGIICSVVVLIVIDEVLVVLMETILLLMSKFISEEINLEKLESRNEMK